ncbi:MAG: tetratricopeptide repeat protein, partial [Bacteroidota bacterium]
MAFVWHAVIFFGLPFHGFANTDSLAAEQQLLASRELRKTAPDKAHEMMDEVSAFMREKAHWYRYTYAQSRKVITYWKHQDSARAAQVVAHCWDTLQRHATDDSAAVGTWHLMKAIHENNRGKRAIAIKYFKVTLRLLKGLKIRDLRGHRWYCHRELMNHFRQQHDHHRSLYHAQERLAEQLQYFGPDHQKVAFCHRDVGIILGELGRYKKALPYFMELLRIQLLHPNPGLLSQVYGQLGALYHTLHDLEKSTFYAELSLDHALSAPAKSAFQVHYNYRTLAINYENMGNTAKASHY